MSRWWTETVAAIGDAFPLGRLAVLLLVAAVLIGAGWYWWPRWVPRSLPRLRRLRWRWRGGPWRRRDRPPAQPEPAVVAQTEQLPDLPAEEFASLADRFAAQGCFAEAVRERLRGIVRELVDMGVVANRPGWTVTELAGAAAMARPPVRAPLDAASLIFSDIWYGQRPAQAQHDARMREYADQVHAVLHPTPVGGVR